MGDITAFMNGRNAELVEVAQEVLKKLVRKVEEKGLELLRRKEQGNHVLRVSGGKLSGMQREWSCFGDERSAM